MLQPHKSWTQFIVAPVERQIVYKLMDNERHVTIDRSSKNKC